MIGAVTVGSSNPDWSAVFYDAILELFGLIQVFRGERFPADGPEAVPEAVEF